MGTRLTIRVPADFVLSRDVCSYGYFLLAPNRWDTASQTLARVLHLAEGPTTVVLAQEILPGSGGALQENGSKPQENGSKPQENRPKLRGCGPIPQGRGPIPQGSGLSSPRRGNPKTQESESRAQGGGAIPQGSGLSSPQQRPSLVFPHRPGAPLRALFDRSLTRTEQAQARRQIARMLRLDEDETHTAVFHALDPRWKSSGRSRLFRSPTLFEDVVKTVTSCNVTWPSTINMNRRLCEVLGVGGAFPTAQRLARCRPGTLRARCRVGYRDVRLVELAKLFVPRAGKPPVVDEAELTAPATTDEAVFAFLTTLPGIGPYAAGNIMMLLGRYSRLAIDTETLSHAKTVLGMKGTANDLAKKLAAHYEPFGPCKFKSYWFERWNAYESKQGFSHNWDHEQAAKGLTVSTR